jgi:hypothetical protein
VDAVVGGWLGVHSLKDEEKIRSKQQRTSNEEQANSHCTSNEVQIRIGLRGRSIRHIPRSLCKKNGERSTTANRKSQETRGATDLPQAAGRTERVTYGIRTLRTELQQLT